jgi:hypothetical protein
MTAVIYFANTSEIWAVLGNYISPLLPKASAREDHMGPRAYFPIWLTQGCIGVG